MGTLLPFSSGSCEIERIVGSEIDTTGKFAFPGKCSCPVMASGASLCTQLGLIVPLAVPCTVPCAVPHAVPCTVLCAVSLYYSPCCSLHFSLCRSPCCSLHCSPCCFLHGSLHCSQCCSLHISCPRPSHSPTNTLDHPSKASVVSPTTQVLGLGGGWMELDPADPGLRGPSPSEVSPNAVAGS